MNANRTVEVIIAPSGEIQIDAVEFKGPDCEKATKFLEEAMISNSAYGGTYGGGAYQSVLSNCTLAGNSGSFGGGANSSTLINCLVSNNVAGTGGAHLEASSTIA
jgi:hypothetical protein